MPYLLYEGLKSVAQGGVGGDELDHHGDEKNEEVSMRSMKRLERVLWIMKKGSVKVSGSQSQRHFFLLM